MEVHGWVHDLYLVLFGTWGAYVGFNGGWALRGEWKLYRQGPRVEAVVVGGLRTIRFGFREMRRRTTEPVVRFVTVDGSQVEARVWHPVDLDETHHIGETFEVFYNPHEPQEAYAVSGFRTVVWTRIVLIGVGSLFMCFAVGGLLFGLRVETHVGALDLLALSIAGAVALARWAWHKRKSQDDMNTDGLPLDRRDDRHGREE
jgi:hypothetical protein